MTQRIKKPKSWILTVLISGAALAYAFFVFLPMQRSIAGIREELKRQRTEVLELGKLNNEVVQLEQQIKAVRTTIDTWHEHAPSRQETATFIGIVSQLAQQAGAHVDRISPRTAVAMSSLVQHPADLSVKGTFSQVADFLLHDFVL